MKFNAWQLVAVMAILLASIIGAHVFAPGAVAIVVSMATTLFAALFVQRKDDGDDEPPSPPNLRLLPGGAAVLAIALTVGGAVACSEGLKSIDEVNDPTDDVKLSKCRADARAEKQVTGDAERGWNVYLACTRDAGLR